MGAVFFFILMAIIFCVAGFFIILNVIFIILWNVKKHSSKPAKKRWLIIPIIFLVINGILILLPIGFIVFLRFANSFSRPEIVYAPSGKTLYWIEGETGSVPCFEVDSVKYVRVPNHLSIAPFLINYEGIRLGEPIANIKYDESGSNTFNDFMHVLLSGRTPSEENVSTLYAVNNENIFSLYCVSTWGNNICYCPEKDRDAVKNYYSDLANYDTQNICCGYNIHADKEQSEKPYDYIRKTVILNTEVFDKLSDLYLLHEAGEQIVIPEKYKEIRRAEKPGTPENGFAERDLFAHSNDNMAYRRVPLALIENQAYIVNRLIISNSDISDFVCTPLPFDLNQYIINTVFTD